MPNRIFGDKICCSETIDMLTPFEETVLHRLIVCCDDFGRCDGRPIFLKSKLFVTKQGLTTQSVYDAILRLASIGLVKFYEVDKKPYLFFPKWELYQQKRAKFSKYPAPDSIGNHLISDAIKCPREASNIELETSDEVSNSNNTNMVTGKGGVGGKPQKGACAPHAAQAPPINQDHDFFKNKSSPEKPPPKQLPTPAPAHVPKPAPKLVPPPVPKSPRRKPITDNFTVSRETSAWAKEKIPDLDIADELEDFRLYHQAAGNEKANWELEFRLWIKRKMRFQTRAPATYSPPAAVSSVPPAAVPPPSFALAAVMPLESVSEEALAPEELIKKPIEQPEVWKDAVKYIRGCVSGTILDTWIRPIICRGVNKHRVLELEVPTESFVTSLQTNFRGMLLKATGAREVSIRCNGTYG